jgi:hypothetical protein
MISDTTAKELGGVNYRREYDCSSEPSGDELRGQRIKQSLLNKCRLDFRVSKEVSKPKFTRSALFFKSFLRKSFTKNCKNQKPTLEVYRDLIANTAFVFLIVHYTLFNEIIMKIDANNLYL